MAETIAPAYAVASGIGTMANDVRTADHGADHSADDRAGRSSDHGAGARADGDAFQCSSLRHEGRGRQH
jgi:hypothetical protein